MLPTWSFLLNIDDVNRKIQNYRFIEAFIFQYIKYRNYCANQDNVGGLNIYAFAFYQYCSFFILGSLRLFLIVYISIFYSYSIVCVLRSCIIMLYKEFSFMFGFCMDSITNIRKFSGITRIHRKHVPFSDHNHNHSLNKFEKSSRK